jgi:hypothetical protein
MGGKKRSEPSDDTPESKSVKHDPTDTPSEEDTDSSTDNTDDCENGANRNDYNEPNSNDDNSTKYIPFNDLDFFKPVVGEASSGQDESTQDVNYVDPSYRTLSDPTDNTDDGDNHSSNDSCVTASDEDNCDENSKNGPSYDN